jgi:hypothetical protein
MELSDKILAQAIKDIYFGKSDLCHKDFCDWASIQFSKLHTNDLEPHDFGVSELTAEVLMDIDAQWDLYMANTFPIDKLQKMDINKVCLPNSYFASWYRMLNKESLGYADRFGWKLQEEIEDKLIEDLNNYRIDRNRLHFDWSDTCIEGQYAKVKGGQIDNLSNVALIDYNGEVVYEGLIDFVFEEQNNYFFEVYWDYLSNGDEKLKDYGIPEHIWLKMPDNVKEKYKDKKIK